MQVLYAAILCAAASTNIAADAPTQADKQSRKEGSPLLKFKVDDIKDQPVDLKRYEGDVLLIVNVASQCGLTPQYKELEALYRKHKDQGLKVLAFPANDFGAQEPGTHKEILSFCRTNYDVTFDLFAKVVVKGEKKCDLYKHLTSTEKNGSFGGEIKWNFTKFLVDHTGKVIERFEPQVKPSDSKMTAAVEKALKARAQALTPSGS